jgi:AraC-like DNA-binding protein
MSKEMLSDTRQSVKSVAYSTGFRDVNYFIRLFRKMEGITPGQYMDLLGKNYSV